MLKSRTDISVTPKNDYTNTNNYENSLDLDQHNIQVVNRQVSICSASSSLTINNNFEENAIETNETQTYGNVSHSVYSSYFSAGGNNCQIVFLFFICIFMQVIASGGDFWMTYW